MLNIIDRKKRKTSAKKPETATKRKRKSKYDDDDEDILVDIRESGEFADPDAMESAVSQELMDAVIKNNKNVEVVFEVPFEQVVEPPRTWRTRDLDAFNVERIVQLIQKNQNSITRKPIWVPVKRKYVFLLPLM